MSSHHQEIFSNNFHQHASRHHHLNSTKWKTQYSNIYRVFHNDCKRVQLKIQLLICIHKKSLFKLKYSLNYNESRCIFVLCHRSIVNWITLYTKKGPNCLNPYINSVWLLYVCISWYKFRCDNLFCWCVGLLIRPVIDIRQVGAVVVAAILSRGKSSSSLHFTLYIRIYLYLTRYTQSYIVVQCT